MGLAKLPPGGVSVGVTTPARYAPAVRLGSQPSRTARHERSNGGVIAILPPLATSGSVSVASPLVLQCSVASAVATLTVTWTGLSNALGGGSRTGSATCSV